MDDFNKTNAGSEAQDSLARGFRSLQNLLLATLAALIVLSAALNLYLLSQVRYASKDLEAVRPQVNMMEAEFKKTTEPMINSFIAGLQNYAKTHPDIVPLLTKYGLVGTSPAGGSTLPPGVVPPTGTPSPAPAVPKK